MEWGTRLRQFRERRGMSIRCLSKQTTVSESHIRNIEQSKVQPTIYTLKKLLDALQISLAEFFSEENEAVCLTAHEKEILYHIRLLSPKKSTAILEFLKVFHDKNRPPH